MSETTREHGYPMLRCDYCGGTGMEGSMDDARDCSCCDGWLRLPLMGWKMKDLERERRNFKLFENYDELAF